MSEQQLQQGVRRFVRTFGLLHRSMTPCGLSLTTSHAHALQMLGEQAPLTLGTLADHLGLEKSTASRLVSNLADRGWVGRAENPKNRRELHLSLTEAGARTLRGITEASDARYARILRGIPAEKRNQVLESLELLIAAARKE